MHKSEPEFVCYYVWVNNEFVFLRELQMIAFRPYKSELSIM